jgi:hypothetical protein
VGPAINQREFFNFCIKGNRVMKTSTFFATLASFVVAVPLANAEPPDATAHQHDHAAPTTAPGAATGTMMERAQQAKTPAERSKLMAENMAMMKAHMAEMNGMMGGKMMDGKPMPMAMDAAHMENMNKHMVMMHEMMERLMVQQELMMKPAK